MNNIYHNKNIVCIWYPSGGFGHFINAILLLRGVDFVRPTSEHYELSDTGHSHQLPLVAPKFLHNPDNYIFDFTASPLTYTLLVDNGIGNEHADFVQQFPKAKIIKLCYSSYTWPIVASTMMHKAMQSSLETELTVDNNWPEKSNWSVREKYFLFLKDHAFRGRWQPSGEYSNILIENMLDYDSLRHAFEQSGIEVLPFDDIWQTWYEGNTRYIDPVLVAHRVLSALQSQQKLDISEHTDLWTQAVVNYFIWLKYNYIVPANDWADWFTDTTQIYNLIYDL